MHARFVSILLLSSVLLPAASRFGMVAQLPGSGEDEVVAMARDPQGNLVVFGHTTSPDLPATVLNTRRLGSSLYRLSGTRFEPVQTVPAGAPAANCFATTRYKPDTIFGVFGERLYRSRDQGATWTMLALPAGLFNCATLRTDYVAPDTMYMHYYGNNTTGIQTARSIDGGLTWAAFGPQIANVLEFVTSPGIPGAYWALGGNASWRTRDGGLTWQETPFALNTLVFDLAQGGVAYATGRVNQQVGAWRTSDNGDTWTPLGALPGPDGTVPVAFATDQTHQGLVYATDSRYVYRSYDSGRTWTAITAAGIYSAMAVNSRNGDLYIYGTNSILISNDEGVTFRDAEVPVNLPVRRLLFVIDAASPVLQVFVPGDADRDLFLAKYTSSGQLLWATYFGGSGFDAAAALAVDARGDIYITGNTSSREYPVTDGAYRPPAGSQPPGTGGFLTKISGDGTRVIYSAILAGQQTVPRALAVDSNGAAWVAGNTGLGSFSPPRNPPAPVASEAVPDSIFGPIIVLGFALRVSPDGDNIDRVHQPPAPTFSSAAVDPAGNLYVGGNQIWRFGADGTESRIQGFELGYTTALAVGANNRLYLTGYTSQRQFPTTPGALQREVPHFANEVSVGFVAALDLTTREVVYSTFLGGERYDAPVAIAVDAKGEAVVGGRTASRAFPLRQAVQGPFNGSTGFIATIAPAGNALVDATFAGDGRVFEVRGLAPAPDGSTFFVGNTRSAGGSYGVDAFLVRLDPPVVVTDLRLDAVLNTASRDASPVAPGALLTLTGDSFRDDARVFVCGAEAAALSRNWKEITVAAPASVLDHPVCEVTVVSNGFTTPPVLMPTARAAPGIFTTDNLGYDFAVAWNEDGSLNSAANPARVGQTLTFAVNGLDASVPLTVVTNHYAPDQTRIAPIAVERREWKGSAAMTFTVRFRLPSSLPGYWPLLFAIENGNVFSRLVPIYIVE